MATADPPPALAPDDRRAIGRYVPVTVLMPTLSAALGVDGGPIFQILAIENLGLSATAIGVAFGLGILSLPLQIYAARIPLERARRNMQLFLVLAAVQAWVLALLVGVGATGGITAVALGITIAAEICVSVLFATAWQPLLSSGLDTIGRQRLNSTWSAVARGLLAMALVVFAALGTGGRTLFLAAIGAFSALSAIGLNAVGAPTATPAGASTGASSQTAPYPAGEPATSTPPRISPAARIVLVVLGAINLGAAPLWLVYLNEVLWPDANLGAIAAAQTVAAMSMLLAWRSTEGDVTRRAIIAAVVTLAATVSIVPLGTPVGSALEQGIVVAATVLMAGGITVTRLALLEATHRIVKPANTVRVFTLVDVVASTSLQAGLFVSGFLIAASARGDLGITDAYRSFILISAVAAVPAILWFQRSTASLRTA